MLEESYHVIIVSTGFASFNWLKVEVKTAQFAELSSTKPIQIDSTNRTLIIKDRITLVSLALD